MTTALSVRNLRKTYKGGHEALKGVSLDVREGDFFALLGPNGAGKTTLIGIVASLVNKSSGSVSIFGHELDTDPASAKACIGLVPQEFNFNMFEPVVEVVANQAGYYGIERREAFERAEKYLRHLDLWDKRRIMARNLSGGMKRRLMIAGAGARSEIADTRRTHGGCRHRDPPFHVAVPEADQRSGHHHHSHHPLPGRGRKPVPQYRHHR
jgi:ABC-2 type transport system ATP-binding protein